MWSNCAHRWKLNYVDKVSVPSPSIAMVFGTAMHEVLQGYVSTLYSSTIDEANSLPLETLLQQKMQEEYKSVLQENNNEHFSNKEEMTEYLTDGIEIIRWFRSHRDEFFIKKGWELVGIELPLNVTPLESHPSVRFIGFLDLVMRNVKTGKIYIYDFKTSTSGWGKYAKGDKVKVSQLVLYKTYYAKQFGIDPEDISVEYIILKRKVNEEAEFAAMKKRISKFEPAHGKVSRKFVEKLIHSFVTSCFNEDGSKKTDVFHAPTAGRNGNNCRFCEFKDRHDLCPVENRIVFED